MDDQDKATLMGYLSQGSFQRLNLRQKNFEGKTPFVLAIESRNLAFLEAVASHESSLDMAWGRFVEIESTEVGQVLINTF